MNGLQCQFELRGTRYACKKCGRSYPKKFGPDVGANCKVPPCQYLGPAVERKGVAVLVKCSCRGQETREVFLPAHKCDVFHRCLPTANMSPEQLKAWAERHESAFYAVCSACPLVAE